MSPTCRFIFSLCLAWFTVGCALAQQQSQPSPDTVASEPPEPKPADTIRHKYLPTGVRVGTDVISIVQSFTKGSFNGWEMNTDLDFYRYFLTIDYGKWARDQNIDNGHYQNDGTYYRVGVDVNFLLKDPDRNMFFLGFRVGRSHFSEQLDYSYNDNVYGAIVKSVSATGVTGGWGEFTTGLRVKILSGFWMGYTARMKFAPTISGANPNLTTREIPGYGLADHAPYWGFNYQIFWRIPIRKP